MRKRIQERKTQAIEEKVAAVDKCKDNARQFEAIRMLKHSAKPKQKLIVNNADGERIMNDIDAAEYVRTYFVSQFSDVCKPPLEAHTTKPCPLQRPVQANEVQVAVKKLKNGRAVGLDGLSAELVKNAPPEVCGIIADVINKSMELAEDLEIGLAKLVTLQKPGKPVGPVKNIRPIALLPLLRKILSLVVLARVRPAVDLYLSASQSGFRSARSCADIIWAHRWLIAKSLKYKDVIIYLLGLDMSRAFDTINRKKLMETLDNVPGIHDDEKRLIRILLANTSIQVMFNGILTKPFVSNIGSPQGDGLSPILFAIYLEAALREVRQRGPQRPSVDANSGLPSEAIYADDTDFISLSEEYLNSVLHAIGPIFGEFNLLVNVDKTDRSKIGHSDVVDDQTSWQNTKKLGSLLGVEEDINRRMQLANVCFKDLLTLWKHPHRISECVRIKSYRVIVESVLLYNCGTWALTAVLADKLDVFQRRLIRTVLGLKWYDKVTNVDLYKRSGITAASTQVLNARWRLFGHTLRMSDDTPAKQAMMYYFSSQAGGRPGNRVTIASALAKEYEAATSNKLRTKEQYESLIELAKDRVAWKGLVSTVVRCLSEKQDAKIERRTSRRHDAKRSMDVTVDVRKRRRIS
jgi:hypothetical protein